MFDTGQVFLWKYRAAIVVRIAAQANDGVQEAMENLLEHVFRNVLGVEQEDPGDFGRQLGKLGIDWCVVKLRTCLASSRTQCLWARASWTKPSFLPFLKCLLLWRLPGSYATRQWIAEAGVVKLGGGFVYS